METKTLLNCPLPSWLRPYKLKIIVFSTLTFLFMGFKLVLHDQYPDTGYTGSTFDGASCVDCHDSYAVNAGNGNVSISTTVPGTGYTPGNTYQITATINHTGFSSFQFSLSPHSASGTPLGVLVDNPTTHLDDVGGGLQYISGEGVITTANTATWTFSWIAPAAQTGQVTFWASFNASDAGSDMGGDYIYTTSHIVQEAAGNPLSSTISASIDLSCNAICTGSATVTAAGGTTPYTYLWSSNNQTTSTATGLCAGTHTVIVTDASSAVSVASASISEPTILTATISPTNISCSGETDGSATVTAGGGTTGYSFTWNTTPPQATATATGLSQGSYTVSVTDNNGCSATANTTITEPTALAVSLTQTPDTATGSNGTATATPAGGTSPYTFLWSDSQTTSTATGLAAGSYDVTVTDSKGCTKTGTVNVIAFGTLYGTISGTNLSCNSVCVGTATVTAIDGTSPYTYLWSNGETTSSVSGLCASTYLVTITDAASGTFTDSISISEPTAIVTSMSSTPDNGSGNGTATVTASGGTPPYTYLWNNGQGTQTATGLATGSISVVVTDASSCTKNDSVDVALGIGSSDLQSLVTIFPNPNNGEFSIQINSLKNGTVTLSVLDVKGQEVFQEKLQITSGKNILPVSMGSERKGIYIIQLKSNDDVVHFPVTLIK